MDAGLTLKSSVDELKKNLDEENNIKKVNLSVYL